MTADSVVVMKVTWQAVFKVHHTEGYLNTTGFANAGNQTLDYITHTTLKQLGPQKFRKLDTPLTTMKEDESISNKLWLCYLYTTSSASACSLKMDYATCTTLHSFWGQ